MFFFSSIPPVLRRRSPNRNTSSVPVSVPAVTIDGALKPTTSALDSALRISAFFGFVFDLNGDLRPTTDDVLTKGAVQR